MPPIQWADVIAVIVILGGIVGAFYKLKGRLDNNDVVHAGISTAFEELQEANQQGFKDMGSHISEMSKVHATNFGTLTARANETKISLAVIINEQKNTTERIDKLEQKVNK